MDKKPSSRKNDGVRRPRRGWPAWLSMRDSPGRTLEVPGSFAHGLRHVAVVLGMIAALVGAGHLAAWLGGYLTQRGLTAITMKTNAALCLTLVGVALMLLVSPEARRARRWVARVCAALALVVGLLTFAENVWGWDFGIDQLLAAETPGALAVINPNRMGMPASLSFTLTGLALLILSRRDRRGVRVAQALALAVCLIALLSTIGFLYGAQEFYGIARFTGIAWPTALALLLLGAGLLCARPAEGLMAQVTADDPGGISLRRLLPAFVILPLLLGWLRLAGERAGLFDAATGTGLMMLVFIITFAALAYHAGRRASHSAQVLRESEERFRRYFELGLIGMAVTSPAKGMVEVNDECCRLLGYKRDELLQKTWAELTHPDDLDADVAQFNRVLAGQIDGYALDKRFIRKDGQVVDATISVAAMRGADGAVDYFLALLQDITERKRAEEALRELNATLEKRVAQRTAELTRRAGQLQRLTLELSQAEERERRRIALLLHEDLQQQIAGARFHLSLLRGRARDDRQRADADRVDAMLREAIEKSRSLSYDLSPAVLHLNDLAEVLQWLVNRVRAQHGLIAHVDALGEMTLQSEALTMFLFRATQEMLFNVVKHARVNEVAIRVRRLGRYVGLSVSDQGRGFDPQELKETSGFGLLSIRERTELLGGRMKIESAAGQGSRFRLVVPDGPKVKSREKTTEDFAYVPAAVTPAFSSGALRVLLVDDHEIVRQGLASLLQEMPEVVVVGEAANGRDAINLANELRPDVVIMDVSMPLMSGDQATRQIKTCLPQTRVIALSMYDEPGKVETMYRAGAESYVLKTAPSEELLAAIRGKEANLTQNPASSESEDDR